MSSVDFESIRRSSRTGVGVLVAALTVAGAWSPGALARREAIEAIQSLAPHAAALAPHAAAPPPCRGARLRPTRSDLPAVDAATVCLIDRIRRTAHLRALRPNLSLQRVASKQSSEMVLGDYFGDDSRSGQTPLQRIVVTRYLRRSTRASTAQNIGWGTGAHATPAAIVAAWMQSPPHRQIVLTGAFRDIGVGAAPAAPAALAAGQPGATYTVEFGTRR
jgi:uncharacterized protein YkwD